MAEYVLKECRTREEHDATIDLFWKVWNVPDIITIIRISHGPFLGEDPAGIAATIAANKERSWNAFKSDPANFRPYVVHVPTGEVVGCIAWKIYPGKPFPDGPQRVQLPYWPENDPEGKATAEEVVNQCFYPRANWMNRPMATMDDTSVHPDHQRKGVGSMMIEAGTRKADELGIECFVEASEAGQWLYKKFGFERMTKVLVDAENGTKERHEMIQKLTPQPVKYWAMWRPKGGVVKDGEPKTLWEALAASGSGSTASK